MEIKEEEEGMPEDQMNRVKVNGIN